MLAAHSAQLALEPGAAKRADQQTGGNADSKHDEQQEDERDFPGNPRVEPKFDLFRVLQRQEEQKQEDGNANDPANDCHCVDPEK
jgi:hypothetical protein